MEIRRIGAACAAVVSLAVLGGCSLSRGLQTGLAEAEVLQRLGAPTARYPMGDGRMRLEYATGPMGRETWMVDLDAQGRVREWFQALDEPRLHAFQAQAPGLSIDELLRALGRPGEIRQVARVAGRPGEVWAWRYPTPECLWYEVSIDIGRRVVDAGFGIDPACDMRGNDRS